MQSIPATLSRGAAPGTMPVPIAKDLNGDGLGYRLLARALEILPAWAPEGRLVGAEFLMLNPRREDAELGSFRINVDTGRWADFAVDDQHARGQGLLSLAAYLNRRSVEDVSRWCRAMIGEAPMPPDAPAMFSVMAAEGTGAAPRAVAPKVSWIAETLPEKLKGVELAYPALFTSGSPDRQDIYRRADGTAYLVVLRWNATGDRKKVIVPACFARPEGDAIADPRWVAAWPKVTLPFGAETIARRATAVVNFLEGEKAREAGEKLLPEDVATCIPGGLNGRCDLTVLAGRTCRVIADADDAGVTKAEKLAQALRAVGATVAVVTWPETFAKGWDVADPTPKGWSDADIRTHIRGAKPAAVIGPDLGLLELARGEAPKLPTSALRSWAGWISRQAVAQGAPEDFVAAGLLTAASGIAAGAVEVEATTTWREAVILWTALVGDASSGKTPALRGIERALSRVEQDLVEDWRTACTQAELEARDEGKKRPPVKPIFPRLRLMDSTVEAAAKALADECKGMLSWQSEMSSWITGLTRYRQGATDRGFWLSAWDGAPSSVSRRAFGDAPLVIPALALSLVATAQPDVLAALFDGPRDGLEARFLFAWPRPVALTARGRETGELVEDDEFAYNAFSKLTRFARGRTALEAERRCFRIRLSDAAYTRFETWRVEYLAAARQRYGSAVPPAIGKAPSQVLRLAGAVALLEWSATGTADDPGSTLALADIEAAIELWNAFEAHRALVEQDIAEPQAEVLARTLARWIVEERVAVIDTRALRREVKLPGLRSEPRIRLALLELQTAGWIHPSVVLPRRDWDPLPAEVPLRPRIAAVAADALALSASPTRNHEGLRA